MLNLLIFWPIASALIIVVFYHRSHNRAKILTLFSCVLELGLILWMLLHYKPANSIQLELPWIPFLGIRYWLSLDGISLLLISLTGLLSLVSVLTAWKQINNWAVFGPLLLTFTGFLIGVFLAKDLILFYIFWELMLVPIYFMMAYWGTSQAKVAATRFLLFTITGSLLMLISFIALAIINKEYTGILDFSYENLTFASLTSKQMIWIVSGMLLGFGVKVPLFPLHIWAPSAYRHSHPVVTLLLSGAMANAGAYAVLRLVLPLIPHHSGVLQVGMALSVIGTLYCALLAFRQKTIQGVLAYSSISHMNLVMLGLFSVQPIAISGAILQLVAHGLSIAGLFAITSMLLARNCLKPLSKMGGLFKPLPVLGGLLLFFVVASVGMPGLGNFTSEILIFSGAFKISMFWTSLATLSVVMGVIYFTKLYENTMLGPLSQSFDEVSPKDLSQVEVFILAVLAGLTVWLGVYPQSFLAFLPTSSFHLSHATDVVLKGFSHVTS